MSMTHLVHNRMVKMGTDLSQGGLFVRGGQCPRGALVRGGGDCPGGGGGQCPGGGGGPLSVGGRGGECPTTVQIEFLLPKLTLIRIKCGWIAGSLSSTNNQLTAERFATFFTCNLPSLPAYT
jgi:hypothetical protein